MQEIKQLIITALTKMNIAYDEEVQLEHPADNSHGDYSTNIAMKLFATVGKEQGYSNPRVFADALAAQMSDHSSQSIVKKIIVAGPGFINFTLSEKWLVQELQKAAEDSTFGKIETLAHKRITVEFTDPNPFKEFHIGHLYSNTVGESISRLLEANSALVRRVCYQGDVGMHVAKSLWGCMYLLLDCTQTSDLSVNEETIKNALLELEKQKSKLPLNEKIKFLGQSYAKGASIYEEDEAAKQQMLELNKLIFAKDAIVMDVYTITKQWSLDYFNQIYKRLGTTFEHLYFESVVAERGKQIVLNNLDNGTFEKSKGAVIFPGSKHGLHDRVFINSLGLPTYEAKELGLAPTKYDDWQYDQSIIITGNEINDYFKVLLKALTLVNPDLAEKTFHLSHGMVRLPEGKMSSRTGKILTGEWLLEEAKTKIIEIMKASKAEFSPQEIEDISEKVSVAAIKWALLKQSIGGSIAFSLEESISFEGNSGPYIQYTYARTQSILRKAAANSPQASVPNYNQINPEELEILRTLYQFPEIVAQAATEYAPHLVATFLFELAQKFNTFYAKHSVLGEDVTEEIKNFRLLLTQATGNVLKSGLHLLGIQAPERM